MTTTGLVVGVSDLLRRPGARREVKRTLRSTGHRVGSAHVPDGADVVLDLVVGATADPDTLEVTGSVRAPWVGECRRCIEPVAGELVLDVHEVFSRAPGAASDDDVWPIDDEQIDVAALVADAVLLALPLAPLCGEDCKGPVPEIFETPDDDEHGGGDEEADGPVDPRWAALDDLRFD